MPVFYVSSISNSVSFRFVSVMPLRQKNFHSKKTCEKRSLLCTSCGSRKAELTFPWMRIHLLFSSCVFICSNSTARAYGTRGFLITSVWGMIRRYFPNFPCIWLQFRLNVKYISMLLNKKYYYEDFSNELKEAFWLFILKVEYVLKI